MSQPLKYIPFETVIDAAFWHVLATKKLNEFRLSEGPFPISAEYTNSLADGLNPRVTVDVSALDESKIKKIGAVFYKIHGELTVVNSFDEFKAVDKQRFIDNFGQEMFRKALASSAFLKDPELLQRFQLLAYCDLKHHKFYFWFSYPAVICIQQPTLLSIKQLDEEFSAKQLSSCLTSYASWRKEHTSSFFVIRVVPEDSSTLDINSCANFDINDDHMYLAFCDPSTSTSFPGWPLRNMLFALCATAITEPKKTRVICFRERFVNGHLSCGHSLLLNVKLQPVKASELTQFVGWEKFSNKLRPRVVDLSTSLDPVKLAESAVDLNLKLMKWRLMPDLDTEILRTTKCLLIGSGTLGCNVARQLLAWGIRHITFIDNATVSMSNPVRQTLFTFNDAQNKAPKSLAAAAALSAIFPGVKAEGVQLDIPMPGHPIQSGITNDYSAYPVELNPSAASDNLPNDVRSVFATCCRLKELIMNHDVIFLLTDTRESRWLPTVMAQCYRKLLINVALGFDSYLVMRHGIKPPGDSNSLAQASSASDSVVPTIAGSELGCYFCNDVVGPTNSTHNRAMDQQCTVTRPGVSMLASALAVEMLSNILHHPDKLLAPAPLPSGSDSAFPYSGSVTSPIPHQIRGFLAQYSSIFPTTAAFKQCPACSQCVQTTFARDGFVFLMHVFNDADYLERVCGLTELCSTMESDDIIALSDEETSDQ